jgi:proteasome lid subunit RPN8/RPN11
MKYTLSFLEYRRLHDCAYRAQQRDQSEVCGALLCTPSGRLRLRFLENQSDRPGHFEMASSELRALRQGQNGTRLRFVGTFHSHPFTCGVPGEGDIRGAPLRHLMLIYDVCGREVRLWQIVLRKGRKTAVQLTFFVVARSGCLISAPNKPLNPPAIRVRASRGNRVRTAG